MRKFFRGLVLVIMAIPATYTHAQSPYDVVYQLYYHLTRSPETGDFQIQTNQELFDNRFYECVSELRSKFQSAALDHYHFCDQVHADPEFLANCKNENEPAKMHSWLSEIVTVTRGDVKWSKSFYGGVTILGKRQFESMGMGSQWTQIIDNTIPPWKPLMLCD